MGQFLFVTVSSGRNADTFDILTWICNEIVHRILWLNWANPIFQRVLVINFLLCELSISMEDFAHLVAELTEPAKKGDYAQVREVLRDAKRTHFLWQANSMQQEAIDK